MQNDTGSLDTTTLFSSQHATAVLNEAKNLLFARLQLTISQKYSEYAAKITSD